MNQRHDWLAWMRQFPTWVTGGIALVTSIIGFVLLIQSNFYLGVAVSGTLLVGALFCFSLYVAFAKTPPLIEGGRGVYRYEKARPWARGLAILLILSTGTALLLQPTRSFLLKALRSAPSTAPLYPQDIRALAGKVVADIGEIDKLTERRGAPVVVVFKELHSSRRGQIEIAIMMNRLYEEYGLRHIGLEGFFAVEDVLDSSWFHPSSNAGQTLSVREMIPVQLLAEGEISSSETMALIYADLKIHGLEKAVEYNIDLTPTGEIADTVYLVAIAKKSMSSDQIRLANALFQEGRYKEGIEYVIKSNQFTQEQYWALRSADISNNDAITILEKIEVEAERVGADLTAEERKDFESLKTFFSRGERRSETMISNLLEVVKKYPTSPVAVVIGAAHAQAVSRVLTESNISFAIIKPKSFGDDRSYISDQALKRALLGQSVDAVGNLGALLDSRKKPPPKLNKVWLRSKAEAYLLAALVARIETKDQPLLSTQLNKELLRMQYVALLPSTFKVMGQEKIFAIRAQVQNLAAPVEVWVRTTTVKPASFWTLDTYLGHSLSTLANHNLSGDKTGPTPIHVAHDVIAIFSADSNIVESTRLFP